MSKPRSLLILLAVGVAVGLVLLPGFKGRATSLDGPNLSVREDVLGSQWVVREEKIAADSCSAIEGEVEPGLRTLVRFTVMTPNTGNQDIFVGDPNDHVAANDGLFEFASCHHHYHFRHYATYELVDPRTGKVWRAAKRGFCMLDTDPNNATGGEGRWNYRNCGTDERDGFQGISGGWSDTYVFKLGGQFFVLDGGDGQPAVPPGVYTIEVEVNPAYPPTGGVCPRVTDPLTGQCHQFAESNYANNIGRATVIITDHPGRSGYGPLKNSDAISAADEIDHKGK